MATPLEKPLPTKPFVRLLSDFPIADLFALCCAIAMAIALVLMPWISVGSSNSATAVDLLTGIQPAPWNDVLVLRFVLVSAYIGAWSAVWSLIGSNKRKATSLTTCLAGTVGLAYYALFFLQNNAQQYRNLLSPDVSALFGPGFWVGLVAALGLTLQVFLPRPAIASAFAAVVARRYNLQVGIVAVLLVMLLFFMMVAPKTFLRPDIYKAFAESMPFYGIIALPITLLVIAQEIDLSFGSVMAASVVAFLAVFKATGSPLLGFIACLGCGFLIGLLNGIIVVKIGIPSLITTIGTQFFWRGFILVVTGASLESLTPASQASPILREVLVGRLFGELPTQVIWMAVVAFLVWLLLNHHRFGAHIYLIGDNTNSARLMGVNVDRTRMLIFAIVGTSAALAGLIASYDVSNFFPSLGDGYLLKTLAAVFLGGTPVLGGTGTILGTFVGCFIIGAIEPGTVAVGLTGFWTQLIYGFIIVVSVAMHTVLRKRIR